VLRILALPSSAELRDTPEVDSSQRHQRQRKLLGDAASVASLTRYLYAAIPERIEKGAAPCPSGPCLDNLFTRFFLLSPNRMQFRKRFLQLPATMFVPTAYA